MKFQFIAGALCLDLINTLDNRAVPERQQELVRSYLELIDWAVQSGALPATQGKALVPEAERHPRDAAATHARVIELRECLYRIFSSVLEKRKVQDNDLRFFNTYLGDTLRHMELHVAREGLHLGWPQASPQLDSVLWPVVRSASELLTSGDLKRVRECGDSTCRWLFVDRSKNHSRRWCDMKVCGNRIKARKFYRRQNSSTRRRALSTA
ncbi:MAG TPA: ABATE domain-containing protein [Terriglobales bacterium]|nr:ABATE domain-containing protein [Terriglobales bacterium]